MDAVNVGRGCLDCINKETTTTKEPCKSCSRWNRWEPDEKCKEKMAVKAARERTKK